MIEEYIINRIKAVARVIDVVSDFCEMKKSGREYTCPCPLHGGTHLDHFKVNPVKNIFTCFVCGESGDAIAFLMKHQGMTYIDAIRWLGAKYGIQVDEGQAKFRDVKPSKPVPVKIDELPTLTLPVDFVKSRMDTREDTLCNWLRGLPWKAEQQARVEKVLRAYAVGHARTGHTIFWQIDDQARVRSGKMMLYKGDGHRDRETPHNFDWIHSLLSRSRQYQFYNPDRQQFRSCLFGLHLLNANGAPKTVNLVESEKTAIIMAIYHGFGNGIWMATGGKQFLKREMLDLLLAYDLAPIVIHPDHDAADEWRRKLTSFGLVERRDFIVNTTYLTAYWRPEDGEKADAADITIRSLMDEHRVGVMESLRDVLQRHPLVQTLIDKLDLEPEYYKPNE